MTQAPHEARDTPRPPAPGGRRELDLAEARRELRADCGRCVALCCVAPMFVASADFALDKPAGVPCPNLRGDDRCGIHTELRGRGFAGCAVFDCFGAGQRVTALFDGATWREAPEDAAGMFGALEVLRQLHEALWYLREAAHLVPRGPLHDLVDALIGTTEGLAASDAATLADIDTASYRREVGDLLADVSAAVRGPGGRRWAGKDLVGARLRGADLRGAELRGAYALGADLRDADLRRCDLLGVDLRGADLAGARLDGALFLTQPQLEAARGDRRTTLPAGLARPGHWSVDR